MTPGIPADYAGGPSLREAGWGREETSACSLQVPSSIHPTREEAQQGSGRTQIKGSSIFLKCAGQWAPIVSRSCGHGGKGTVSGVSKSPGLKSWKGLRFGLLLSSLNKMIYINSHTFSLNI